MFRLEYIRKMAKVHGAMKKLQTNKHTICSVVQTALYFMTMFSKKRLHQFRELSLELEQSEQEERKHRAMASV